MHKTISLDISDVRLDIYELLRLLTYSQDKIDKKLELIRQHFKVRMVKNYINECGVFALNLNQVFDSSREENPPECFFKCLCEYLLLTIEAGKKIEIVYFSDLYNDKNYFSSLLHFCKLCLDNNFSCNYPIIKTLSLNHYEVTDKLKEILNEGLKNTMPIVDYIFFPLSTSPCFDNEVSDHAKKAESWVQKYNQNVDSCITAKKAKEKHRRIEKWLEESEKALLIKKEKEIQQDRPSNYLNCIVGSRKRKGMNPTRFGFGPLPPHLKG